MILCIRNHLLFYTVSDCNGEPVSLIKDKRPWSADKEILNRNRQAVYTVCKKPAPGPRSGPSCRYLIFRSAGGESAVAAASLIYKEERQTICRLPEAIELAIQSIYGGIRIKRLTDRLFSMTNEEKELGRIVLCRMFRSGTIYCKEIEDPEFLSALFMFAYYMQHENDLIVI